MKLLAVRDMNLNDPLPGLGTVVRKEQKPPLGPGPQPTDNSHIRQKPDGMLETNLPLPAGPEHAPITPVCVNQMTAIAGLVALAAVLFR